MQKPELASLLDVCDLGRRNEALAFLEKELAPCFFANWKLTHSPSEQNSRIGGVAFLPVDLPHPCDRAGKPMTFIAQINFNQIPAAAINKPEQGLLLLFWNAARDHSNPKDRHAFRCVWLPTPESISLVQSNFADSTLAPCAELSFTNSWSLPEDDEFWNEQSLAEVNRDPIINQLQQGRCIQLFGQAGKHFERMQEIAAFAGNGVSWSPARSGDSCFSHLRDNAKDWRLLMQISSIPECGLDLGALSIYLLIQDADLQQHNYNKSWLLLS